MAKRKSTRTKAISKAKAEAQNGGSNLVRFAVVGAGHIAQNAMMPAFDNARDQCVLTTIFSDDSRKRAVLGRRYHVDNVFGYDDFEAACDADLFDAVYIALPNSLHCEFVIRAARAGIHILCEKPMAVTSRECRMMLNAVRENNVKLMIAYRLHFEHSNMKAVEIVRSGRIGEPRYFNSTFSMQVKPGNIRTRAEMGGGPLHDIGIYCLNAARYLFRSEPVEVIAMAASNPDDPRFREVDECVTVSLRFPGERLANFICSFGAADTACYQIVGTKGDLAVDRAYEYEEHIEHMLTIHDATEKAEFAARDQFGPELIYFSQCIRDNKEPEPGGEEGMIDVMIIEKIFESLRTGRSVRIPPLPRDRRPSQNQTMRRSPVRKRELVHAVAPHR